MKGKAEEKEKVPREFDCGIYFSFSRTRVKIEEDKKIKKKEKGLV